MKISFNSEQAAASLEDYNLIKLVRAISDLENYPEFDDISSLLKETLVKRFADVPFTKDSKRLGGLLYYPTGLIRTPKNRSEYWSTIIDPYNKENKNSNRKKANSDKIKKGYIIKDICSKYCNSIRCELSLMKDYIYKYKNARISGEFKNQTLSEKQIRSLLLFEKPLKLISKMNITNDKLRMNNLFNLVKDFQYRTIFTDNYEKNLYIFIPSYLDHSSSNLEYIDIPPKILSWEESKAGITVIQDPRIYDLKYAFLAIIDKIIKQFIDFVSYSFNNDYLEIKYIMINEEIIKEYIESVDKSDRSIEDKYRYIDWESNYSKEERIKDYFISKSKFIQTLQIPYFNISEFFIKFYENIYNTRDKILIHLCNKCEYGFVNKLKQETEYERIHEETNCTTGQS